MEVKFIVGDKYRYFDDNGRRSQFVYKCHKISDTRITFKEPYYPNGECSYTLSIAQKLWRPEIPKKIRKVNAWK